MARPRKAPAFLVTTTVNKSQRLADLPSDSARLGYFYAVLPQAKLAPIQGQFASRTIFREVAGRFARFERSYIAVGVLEVAPNLCDRCKARWKEAPRRGVLVVHDWHEHQYDPNRLDQQRLWDAEHRGVSDRVSDTVSDGYLARAGDAPTSGARQAHVGRTSNVERISPEEDRSSSVPPDRPDVAALLARPGWNEVTRRQLGILDEIADRHDRPAKGESWGAWAAGVIAETPIEWDPIGNLMAIDGAWQRDRRAEVDAEEARYASEKAARNERHAGGNASVL